ncbi:hypothetical protein [Mesorhizobium sp.]|uniref:hypothetical protein n=1 Tax=Mesorhizobium sp. TaxID=1871066 RepID=UPI000FE585E2|nr:hypothetical protein [Mesorhizobium sp.]RWK53490.1 MAG: hypothetical protein EOR48_22075 [Mesorhizobium sp.]
MTIEMKESGPPDVVRPFRPSLELHAKLSNEQRQTEAIEHIAVSLSAIDNNIERLVSLFEGYYKVMAANVSRR